MEKIKLQKLGFTVSAKDLSLSLIPTANAEGCPTVTEWYSEVLLDETSREHFLNVPFNKDRKRIPNLKPSGRTLQPFTCDWNGRNIDLDAKLVSVDKMSVMYDVCITDIEESFEVDNMLQGANNQVNPQAFVDYMWKEIARYAHSDLEELRWLGDKTATGDTFQSLTNGYVTLIEDNISDVIEVTSAVAITPTNVIDEIYRTIGVLKPEHQVKPEELSIFVSANVALAFAVAASKGNSIAYVTGDMGKMFLGKYELITVGTLADDTIIAGPKQDFIYTYDLPAGEENFITADLTYSMAIPVVRFRLNLYVGFDIYNYGNIAYYQG